MASFSSDIAKYAKKTGLSIDNAVIAVCAEASTSIIKRSPVDTGRFRSNWFASINDISTQTSETRTEGEAIADSILKAQKASGAIFTLSNNLPYAIKLEFGSSKQAPQGVLRITADEIETSLRRL